MPVLPPYSEPTGTRKDVAVVAIHTGRARGQAGRLQVELWDGGDTAVGRGCGQAWLSCCHPSVTEKKV